MMTAIRPTTDTDRKWMRQFMVDHWSGEAIIARGQVIRPHEQEGFVAFDGQKVMGLITYRVDADRCEVLSLDSLRPGHGVGSGLLNALIAAATFLGCKRLTLITTNDNLHALAFYQKRGFVTLRTL